MRVATCRGKAVSKVRGVKLVFCDRIENSASHEPSLSLARPLHELYRPADGEFGSKIRGRTRAAFRFGTFVPNWTAADRPAKPCSAFPDRPMRPGRGLMCCSET
jgi:hypothetical protein